MCGRYTLTSAPEVLRALFRYEEQLEAFAEVLGLE